MLFVSQSSRNKLYIPSERMSQKVNTTQLLVKSLRCNPGLSIDGLFCTITEQQDCEHSEKKLKVAQCSEPVKSRVPNMICRAVF